MEKYKLAQKNKLTTEFTEREKKDFIYFKKRGMLFSVYSVVKFFSVVLLPLLFVSSAMAQSVAVTPQLLEKAIGLFPEQKGPYELRIKDDVRVHELRFQLINYTLMAGGNEAGIVTRIITAAHGESEGFDVLARFDEKGRTKGMANLKQAAPGKAEAGGADIGVGTEALLSYFNGKDIREDKDTLIKLFNGLALGYNMKDAKPSLKPPKDKVWDLTGKVLEQGARLPLLKTKDLNGKAFNTEKIKGKFLMVFTSPTCRQCDGMITSLGRALDLFDGSKKITAAYAVAAEVPAAQSYVKRFGIKGIAIAEPDDHVSNAFMAPFKPYALMFENGKLKYNLLWKEEKQLFGILFVFINGRPPTLDEVKALEIKLEAMGLKK